MKQDLEKLRAAVGQDGIIQIVHAVGRLGGGDVGRLALFEVMRSGWVVMMRPLDGGPSEAVRVLST